MFREVGNAHGSLQGVDPRFLVWNDDHLLLFRWQHGGISLARASVGLRCRLELYHLFRTAIRLEKRFAFRRTIAVLASTFLPGVAVDVDELCIYGVPCWCVVSVGAASVAAAMCHICTWLPYCCCLLPSFSFITCGSFQLVLVSTYFIPRCQFFATTTAMSGVSCGFSELHI